MMYPEEDVVPVALAILRVSEPDAETSDLTDLDLDEARAALRVVYAPKAPKLLRRNGW